MDKNNKIKLELLAPAKNKDCAITAILSGADAVYIGANSFGARVNASNSLEDIKDIIDFAHIFGVKIYVTVNTILFDNELEDAKNLIKKLYDIKTDAIIFQDFSILNMDIPPIDLHASTQCFINSIDKIKFLEKNNISRVVLPRETSLNEIKNIKKNTNIELENFIHGALCVSYSGQCYLSYNIGKRSANRGCCGQPCRKKYSLIDKNGKIYAKNTHLLCLKDLSFENETENLINAGITSFKIEGRLKDELYIKNTVLHYRKIIDNIIKKSDKYERASHGVVNYNFDTNLDKTFNREYCEYFLNEQKPLNITSFDTPKHRGEFVGVVKSVNNKEVILEKLSANLHSQDGITFFDEKNELQGTKIISVSQNKLKLLNSSGIRPKTKLYRNIDFEYLKDLKNFKLSRKIPVNISVSFDKNIKFRIYNNDYSYTSEFENVYEIANNQDLAKNNLEKQFSKLSGTNFFLQNLEINSGKIPYFKLSELNKIRNDLISNFEKKLIEEYKPKLRILPKSKATFPIKNLDYTFNISNNLAKDFYEKSGSKVAEWAYEKEKPKHAVTLMTTKHCIKRALGLCSKKLPTLFLQDEYGKKYELAFDCANCEMKIFDKNIS